MMAMLLKPYGLLARKGSLFSIDIIPLRGIGEEAQAIAAKAQ
jgi:hypothetical protein